MNAATRKARVQMERELARIESRPPVEAVPPPLMVQHTLSGAPDGIEAFLLRPELGRGLLRTWDPPRMHAPIIASKNWLTPPPNGGVGLEPDEMWLPLIDSGSLDGWVGRVPALGQRGECTCYFAVAGASVAGQMSVDPDSYLDIFVLPAHRRTGVGRRLLLSVLDNEVIDWSIQELSPDGAMLLAAVMHDLPGSDR